MKFNDSNNPEESIVDDIDFFCNTDSTSFPIEDKTRRVNQWYYRVQTDIMRTDARFQFGDRNHGKLPEYTADLQGGQQIYELPDEFMEVHAVEIKETDGEFYRLDQIDIQDLEYSISNYRDEDGKPMEYDLTSDVIRLFPAPDPNSVTLSNGLKVYITRNVSVFDSGDTTKEPGFDNAYHQILSLGPSVDYLAINGTNENRNEVQTMLQELRQELIQTYQARNVESNPQLRTKQKNSQKYM